MFKKLQLQPHLKIEKNQGRAMLRWDGKRPPERIEYFPAQEKEIYGNKNSIDFNKLFWGDNIQVLAHLLKEYRGEVDLVYIDPPFDSKADYVKRVKIRGNEFSGVQQGILEEKQYGDIWDKDEWLQFMYERLILIRELMSEKASIFVHIDYHRSSHLRLLMDEVFGEDNFRNEIIWYYPNKIQGNIKRFAANHDNICWYSKTSSFTFNRIEEERAKSIKVNARYWDAEKQSFATKKDEKGNVIYIDRAEKIIDDVWIIPAISSGGKDQTNYPTQKPEEILERIIVATSGIGDLVLDCFVGSGTTAAVAQKLGRRWIGCDINIGAIQTSTKRLNQISLAQVAGTTNHNLTLLSEEEGKDAKTKTLFGFKVCNVNEYDVFKNEVEAKDIVMEMYGVEQARLSHFDGMLDNSFVKVMPINRVCSKKDIDDVLKAVRANLADFTAKIKSRHGESVYEEGVTVFCSGFEMDMIDYLMKNNDTGVDIDIRDILLDKQTLIFKQRPEAEITVKCTGKKVKIIIDDFISPILMRKLEIENEKVNKNGLKTRVEDYRQVIDSVAIDVDYDSNLFNAEIIDVPAKNELIKSEYNFEYPKTGKKRLAVKIVDVLGEEYFKTFEVTL